MNVGSVTGLTAHHTVAYTKVAALEPAPAGHPQNVVHPGCIETPLMASANPVFVQAHGPVKAITNALDGA
ncbi:hypothetical protein [Streptomyces canus]|uniref:hypothetical protein n=1 Tax=Streptomyces canus TaxID=58343 RepID=UPI002E27BEC7|nr:hypothetical protein [Streptomyces canus]